MHSEHRRLLSMCMPGGTLAVLALSCAAAAVDAPTFIRPYDGVPIDNDQFFIRVVPESEIDITNDDERHLDIGGGPESLPAFLPPRFSERTTTPSTTGMTAGHAFLGQFIDHDLDLTRTRTDLLLIEPFVQAVLEFGLPGQGEFQNRRVPGFDLDSVYRITPESYPNDGTPETGSPWDTSNLRFRFSFTEAGALDFIRALGAPGGMALIGDPRNDENGLIAHVHRAFMRLHNKHVDYVLERDNIDETALTLGDPVWTNVFHEARNYTTAFYQGIVCHEFATMINGRSLFDAMADDVQAIGPLDPQIPVEFAAAVFRLHTIVPTDIQYSPTTFFSPVDDRLRLGIPFYYLIGEQAGPAGKIDTRIAAPLRDIVGLMTPGIPPPITLDLAQVNLLRGREMRLPSGEEYLARLMDELGLDPETTTVIRGKQVLTPAAAATILTEPGDADLLADINNGDTDIWAYAMLEGDLNNGVLGPVGQDVVERTWVNLLLADDWSLVGKHSDQFTNEMMAHFSTATFERLLSEILVPADINQDLVVNARDLAMLLGQFGHRGDLPADLNEDDIVNGADLAILLGSWGA